MIQNTSLTLTLTNVTNGSGGAPTSVTAISSNTTLVPTITATAGTSNTYSLKITPGANLTGTATITVFVKNSSSDILNTTAVSFTLTIIPFVNHAPNVNPIGNVTVGLNYKGTMQYIDFTGVNDGNNGTETVNKPTYTLTNSSVIRLPYINYTTNATGGNLEFYPNELGVTTVTMTFQNNGSTLLGGENTKTVTFPITVVTDAPNLSEVINTEDYLTVYPNPCSDIVHVKLPDNNYTSLQVIDLTGKTVFEKNVTSLDEKIVVKNFSSGIYFIKAIGQNGIKKTKIIVTK